MKGSCCRCGGLRKERDADECVVAFALPPSLFSSVVMGVWRWLHLLSGTLWLGCFPAHKRHVLLRCTLWLALALWRQRLLAQRDRGRARERVGSRSRDGEDGGTASALVWLRMNGCFLGIVYLGAQLLSDHLRSVKALPYSLFFLVWSSFCQPLFRPQLTGRGERVGTCCSSSPYLSFLSGRW